jgi:hypothetical protein
MTPDIDVTSAFLLRERDPDQAVGIAELDAGDERRAAFRPRDRLLVLEPVADASSKELWDVCPLRLVSAEPGLEITGAGSVVVEQPVKRQPGGRYGHHDRGVAREGVRSGNGKRHHLDVRSRFVARLLRS